MALMNWWKFDNNIIDEYNKIETNDSMKSNKSALEYMWAMNSNGIRIYNNTHLYIKNPFIQKSSWGISFWVKDFGTADWCNIITFSDSTQRIEVYGSGSNWHWYVNSPSHNPLFSNKQIASGFTRNTWHHVVITFNNGISNLYIDNVNKHHATNATAFIDDGTNKIYFGSRGSGQYAYIQLADLRFYNNYLSEFDVNNLYNNCIAKFSFSDPYNIKTTNLVPQNSLLTLPKFGSGWGSGHTQTNVYKESYYIPNKKYNEVSVNCSGTVNGGCNATFAVITAKPSTKYTMSVYLKIFNGENVLNVGNYKNRMYIYEYDANNKKIREYGIADENYKEYIGDGWYRYYKTIQTHANCVKINFSTFIYPNRAGNMTYSYAAPQIEERDFLSPFVIGNRNIINISDNSGWNNNLEIHNNIEISKDSPVGSQSIEFNNGNGYLRCPNKFFKSGDDIHLTISFWGSINNTGTNQNIFSCRSSPGNGLSLFVLGGLFRLDCGQSCMWSIGYGPAMNKWNMYTFVANGNNRKYYLNGEFVKEINYSGKDKFAEVDTNFNIGHAFSGSSDNGYQIPNGSKLTDFRIYNSALSANDIKDLYESHIYVTNNQKMYSSEFVENANDVSMEKTGVVSCNELNETNEVEIYNNGKLNSNEFIEL